MTDLERFKAMLPNECAGFSKVRSASDGCIEIEITCTHGYAYFYFDLFGNFVDIDVSGAM